MVYNSPCTEIYCLQVTSFLNSLDKNGELKFHCNSKKKGYMLVKNNRYFSNYKVSFMEILLNKQNVTNKYEALPKYVNLLFFYYSYIVLIFLVIIHSFIPLGNFTTSICIANFWWIHFNE